MKCDTKPGKGPEASERGRIDFCGALGSGNERAVYSVP